MKQESIFEKLGGTYTQVGDVLSVVNEFIEKQGLLCYIEQGTNSVIKAKVRYLSQKDEESSNCEKDYFVAFDFDMLFIGYIDNRMRKKLITGRIQD